MPVKVREPISPRFAHITDVMVALMPWIGMAIGGGLVGVSIWGFRFCRSLVRSVAVPSETSANQAAQVLSWLVLFAPFALLGVVFLGSCLRQVWASASAGRTPDRTGPVILPPQTGNLAQASGPAGAWQGELDDATVRRLDELGERAAKILNVGAGLFLLISGLCGFLVAWISTYHPIRGQIFNFGLSIRFLLLCGFFVFTGSAMLRYAFKKADTAWLIPLKIFTVAVSRRVGAEGMARQSKSR